MDFGELFANVCEALRREQRISYRALFSYGIEQRVGGGWIDW